MESTCGKDKQIRLRSTIGKNIYTPFMDKIQGLPYSFFSPGNLYFVASIWRWTSERISSMLSRTPLFRGEICWKRQPRIRNKAGNLIEFREGNYEYQPSSAFQGGSNREFQG
jgi:hypothetical protein